MTYFKHVLDNRAYNNMQAMNEKLWENDFDRALGNGYTALDAVDYADERGRNGFERIQQIREAARDRKEHELSL